MRKVFSWGLLALASVIPAGADDVTEQAFLAALDQGHAAVRALGAELAGAEAARRRAGTLSNPRVEFWRERPGESPSLTNWTIAWMPPLDGRFGLGKSAAAARVAAARADLALDRAGLRREMRRVFADWSFATARCALLIRRLERVTRLAEQERQRARLGTESGLAARRLTLAEAEVRGALREAEAGRLQAEAQARAWQPGLSDQAEPVLAELPPPPEDVDPAASPRIRAEEHRLEQARLEKRLAGRFWGFPTLQAGVQRLEEGGLVESGPLLAASWSIPLFDRSQGGRAEAQARADIAASRTQHVRALTFAEIQGGLAAYRSLFAAAREADEASAETEPVIEAATAAYRAGEASLTDLLDALGSAFDARLRELEMRALALAAHRDLEAAVGRSLIEGGAR